MSKPVEGGAYADQRLNFATMWEGSLTICQGFKPDLRNSAVRHYRGASGNVIIGEIVNPPRNRKGESGTPPPNANASEFYPNQCVL